VATESVPSLSALFQSCLGDVDGRGFQPGIEWSSLRVVSLQKNNLTSLDESLKLLPNVEYLDLSRNSIETIENLQVK